MTITFVRRTAGALPSALIRRDLKRAAAMLRGSGRALGELSRVNVVTVSSAESRRMKRRYLKRDEAANVLAFSYDGWGEIILTPAIIGREARISAEPYRIALRRMAIHGFLHLAGCHHESSGRESRNFQRLESAVLNRLKIA